MRGGVASRKYRGGLILAGIAIATWLGVETYRAGLEEVPPPSQIPIDIENGNAEGRRLTAHSWELTYGRVHSSSDGTLVDADDVKRAVIFRHGAPYITLRADHVTVNLATKDFSATGRVHAEQRGANGALRLFDTTQASWADATQILLMPDAINLSSKGDTLHVTGISLNVKTGATHMGRIDGDVKL